MPRYMQAFQVEWGISEKIRVQGRGSEKENKRLGLERNHTIDLRNWFQYYNMSHPKIHYIQNIQNWKP